MIKRIILFCALCSTFQAYSQETKKGELMSQPIKAEKKSGEPQTFESSTIQTGQGATYSVGRNGEQVEHTKEYYQNQLESIENHINAIDTKVEIIKKYPMEHQSAIDSGWYQKMESTKNKLQEKKKELSAKIKSLS